MLARRPSTALEVLRSVLATRWMITFELEEPAVTTKPRLLFVCTHNAGRSALGSALARQHAGDRIEVESAGTDPDPDPSPVTIATLAELGIDASAHRPAAITPEAVAAADVVVAMKPGLAIPEVPGVRYETWDLPDPAEWDADGIRPLREEIDRRVRALLAELGTPEDGENQ